MNTTTESKLFCQKHFAEVLVPLFAEVSVPLFVSPFKSRIYGSLSVSFVQCGGLFQVVNVLVGLGLLDISLTV